ncbi:hypothetical protein QYM36_001059, partial [Artemia franciscana]
MHLGAQAAERNVVLTSFCAEGIFMWLLLIWLIAASACMIVLLTNCCRSKGETKSQTEYEYMDWKALEEARVRLRSQYAVQTLKRRPAHTLRRCVSDSDLSMNSCDDLIAPPAPPLPPGPLFANNRSDLNRRMRLQLQSEKADLIAWSIFFSFFFFFYAFLVLAYNQKRPVNNPAFTTAIPTLRCNTVNIIIAKNWLTILRSIVPNHIEEQNMDCDYEKVRNNTMCILTVSPDGLPLPRFLKEYSETISETFPYRELGYKTPLDCLRSFKNVLNVINNPRGNDPLLVAIPENKVIHMRKLVAQQKSVSKQSKIIKSVYHNLEKRRNAQGILKTNFEPRRKMEEEKPIKSNEEESRFYVPKVDGPPKRQMVELTPSASSQKYNIIEESLDDNVPKTLDELKTNIKLLMSRHPEGIQLHSFSECYQELFCHTINPCFYGMTNLKGLLINFSPFIKVQDENVILTCEEDVEEKLKIAHRQKLKALKKRILSICEKYREKGVLLTQLSDIHKEIYDTRIKPSDFGFSNLSQILLEFRGEVKLEDSEKGLVIYESGYRPKWMKRILVPNLPASVQNRIETVLKIYQKGGIFMDKLEFGYQHHFKMNFVLSEWGYESLEDLVNYLEGKILRIDKYANDRLLLHYLPMAERDPHSLPISFDCSIISDWAVPIPENVVHPLSLFKRSKLPKDININSEVFLAAGEIISPGKFYFQFADENQKTEFEDTEYKMNDFYLNNYQQYLLPKDNIIKGMVVAVPYENFWHRARVVDPNDFQKIRLFCFDYGTYFDACLTQICYLEERFYTYPAQGHIGCLASIEPVGGQWDRNATNLFLDWFKEKVLFAYVKKIEETGKYPVVHLEVHYTHDNLDFCVNEYL